MFKHLQHIAKAALASIILATPIVVQAEVDMGISNFTADQSFRFFIENKQNQDTAITRFNASATTESAAIKTALSKTRSDANPNTNNFSSLDKTPSDTSLTNNNITTP